MDVDQRQTINSRILQTFKNGFANNIDVDFPGKPANCAAFCITLT